MRRGRSGPVLLLALAASLSCASIEPPRMQVFGPIDAELEPVVYVTTNRDREVVLAELTAAGFRPTSDLREAPLVLEVKLGRSRGSRDCGSIRNVFYDLRHAGGVRIAVVKARGWTGQCRPTILSEVSAELASLFLSVSADPQSGRP